MLLYLLKEIIEIDFLSQAKKNTFGDVNIPYIMVDSGCNTFLLNLESKNTLKELVKKFPTTNGDHSWTINAGGSVATLQSPVLRIKRTKQPQKYDIVLAADIDGGFKMESVFLRFHLSLEDVEEMINLASTVLLTQDEVDMLKQHQAVASLLKSNFNIEVGIRRKHALLGQSLLSNYTSIQVSNSCLLVVDPNQFKWNMLFNINSYYDKLGEQIFNHITELNDTLDYDHEGDDPSVNENDYID